MATWTVAAALDARRNPFQPIIGPAHQPQRPTPQITRSLDGLLTRPADIAEQETVGPVQAKQLRRLRQRSGSLKHQHREGLEQKARSASRAPHTASPRKGTTPCSSHEQRGSRARIWVVN